MFASHFHLLRSFSFNYQGKTSRRYAKLIKKKTTKKSCFTAVWGLSTYGKGNWAIQWNKILRHFFWVDQRMIDVLKCNKELWEAGKEASVWTRNQACLRPEEAAKRSKTPAKCLLEARSFGAWSYANQREEGAIIIEWVLRYLRWITAINKRYCWHKMEQIMSAAEDL